MKKSLQGRCAGLRALDGIKPGLAKKLKAKGAQITQVRRNMRAHGEPEILTKVAVAPGTTCTILWKSAHETLADEVLDQSLLHWRHAFVV